MIAMSFGEFVRQKRMEKRITLRDFCRQVKYDPSNWSKIERGKIKPPTDKSILENVARVLDIANGSEEWNTLKDFATVGHIPIELLDDESIVQKLPVFFRTLRGEKPSRRDLEELISMIRES